MEKRRKSSFVLVYAPTARGGLAEHIHYQATELSRRNINVTVLTTPGFLDGRPHKYAIKKTLINPPVTKSIFVRRLLFLFTIVYNQYYLSIFAFFSKPAFILLESYTEYFSPFWVWGHLLNSSIGIKYIANVHDPVRDYVVGGKSWHKLSVSLAYLPIFGGLIHRELPSPSPVPAHVKIAEAPVGSYELTTSSDLPEIIKNRWNFPDNAFIFLSFGYIRDGKNLDLFMNAQSNFKDVYLVVLGSIANSSSKGMEYYKSVAKHFDISDRVYISDQFVPDEWVEAIFQAADSVLLTYSSAFVSQSGVLNVAAKIKKPILASSGPSPLKDSIERFDLGVFVQPDSIEAIADGIDRILHNKYPTPDWSRYLQYASWETNVDVMIALADIKNVNGNDSYFTKN